MNKLSVRVKTERDMLGITQKDFADLLGISFVSVNKIEHSQEAGAKIIKALAKYFKVETKVIRKEMLENENHE